METKRKFDKELKVESVKLILAGKRNVKEVSDYLEVKPQVVYAWIKEYKHHGENAFPGYGYQNPEDELTRLKKENEKLKWENDMLKKLRAYSKKKHL